NRLNCGSLMLLTDGMISPMRACGSSVLAPAGGSTATASMTTALHRAGYGGRARRWLVELDAALVERTLPTRRLPAEEGFELLRRAADRRDAGAFQLPEDCRIGEHGGNFALDLL